MSLDLSVFICRKGKKKTVVYKGWEIERGVKRIHKEWSLENNWLIRSGITVTDVARSRSGEDEVSEGKAIEAAIDSEVRVT